MVGAALNATNGTAAKGSITYATTRTPTVWAPNGTIAQAPAAVDATATTDALQDSLWKSGSHQQLSDTPTNTQDRELRSRLLWVFPDATTLTIGPSVAWEGTILAPNAAVTVSGSVPIRGTLIAHNVTGVATLRSYPLAPQLELP